MFLMLRSSFMCFFFFFLALGFLGIFRLFSFSVSRFFGYSAFGFGCFTFTALLTCCPISRQGTAQCCLIFCVPCRSSTSNVMLVAAPRPTRLLAYQEVAEKCMFLVESGLIRLHQKADLIIITAPGH